MKARQVMPLIEKAQAAEAADADEARRVMRLSGKIGHRLAGKGSTTQGAVLADLMAMWLAGHVVQGDPVATEQLRARMLAHQIEAISALTKINARLIGTELLATKAAGTG